MLFGLYLRLRRHTTRFRRVCQQIGWLITRIAIGWVGGSSASAVVLCNRRAPCLSPCSVITVKHWRSGGFWLPTDKWLIIKLSQMLMSLLPSNCRDRVQKLFSYWCSVVENVRNTIKLLYGGAESPHFALTALLTLFTLPYAVRSHYVSEVVNGSTLPWIYSNSSTTVWTAACVSHVWIPSLIHSSSAAEPL